MKYLCRFGHFARDCPTLAGIQRAALVSFQRAHNSSIWFDGKIGRPRIDQQTEYYPRYFMRNAIVFKLILYFAFLSHEAEGQFEGRCLTTLPGSSRTRPPWSAIFATSKTSGSCLFTCEYWNMKCWTLSFKCPQGWTLRPRLCQVLYCKQWMDQIIGSVQVYIQYFDFDFNMAEAVVVLRSVAWDVWSVTGSYLHWRTFTFTLTNIYICVEKH